MYIHTQEMSPVHLSLDEVLLKDLPEILMPIQQEYMQLVRGHAGGQGSRVIGQRLYDAGPGQASDV